MNDRQHSRGGKQGGAGKRTGGSGRPHRGGPKPDRRDNERGRSGRAAREGTTGQGPREEDGKGQGPADRGSARKRTGREEREQRGDQRRTVPPSPRPRPAVRRSKPELPQERPHLPRDVHADIRASSGSGDANDIARALGGAEAALSQGDPDAAIAYLEWAKTAAARSWAVREALGIAYYLAGRYKDAHRELVTYRRLSGRDDQNHLLADCARAEGQHDKMRAYVEAMLESDVDTARKAEGVMVLAGDRMDREDLHGALRTLEQVRVDPQEVSEPHLRLWFMESDLRARLGQTDRSEELRRRIESYDPGWLSDMES